MRFRALPLLGALVVLLGSVSSTAGAIEFTVKRYAAIKSFEAMTDEQAVKWLKTAELKDPQTFTVVATSINRNITWNAPNSTWKAISSKYPNENINAWKGFNAQYEATLPTLGGGGSGTYISLGKCFAVPGAITGVSGVDNTSNGLQPLEVFGRVNETQGGTRYSYYFDLAGKQGVLPPGDSYYLSDYAAIYSQASKSCYKAVDIVDFSGLSYGPVTQPIPFLGNALRGAAIAYFEEEEFPNYQGMTVAGYTDSELLAECTAALCPGYTPGGSTDPGTGTGGTGGTSTPPCTTADGTTSGNPYDCAPKDEETKCSFIDIPCNLKYLFIPRKDFLTEKLKDGVGLTVKFPITISNEWMADVKFAGNTFKVGARFDVLNWSEETKDQFRFYAWWSTFLFLLAYLGVPFMAGKKGMADAAQDSTVGAAAREQAANDKAKADYDRLRADDSWKYP